MRTGSVIPWMKCRIAVRRRHMFRLRRTFGAEPVKTGKSAYSHKRFPKSFVGVGAHIPAVPPDPGY